MRKKKEKKVLDKFAENFRIVISLSLYISFFLKLALPYYIVSDINGDMEWSIEEVDAVLQLEVRIKFKTCLWFYFSLSLKQYHNFAALRRCPCFTLLQIIFYR